MSFKKQTPSDFLKLIIGKPVVVKLNSGVDYRGDRPSHGVLQLDIALVWQVFSRVWTAT